jgi:hypothetical protein
VSRRWKEIALLSGALGTILLALLVGLATVHFREKRPDQLRVVFTVPRDPARFPQFNLPAISPDGTRVVFFGPGDGGKLVLWSRALDSLAIQSLAGTEISSGPPYPFWSPDGHFIAFFSGGKLKRSLETVAHLRRSRSHRTRREEVGDPMERSFSAPRSVPYIASRLREARRRLCASSMHLEES